MVLLAPKVEAKNSGALFLIAAKVAGEVTVLFGLQAALVFGAVCGAALALVLRPTRRK